MNGRPQPPRPPGPEGNDWPEPALERLIELDARGELDGMPARLAALIRQLPPPAGLDDGRLARGAMRLRAEARPRRRLLRLAVAAGALFSSAASMALAAHYAGVPVPFLSERLPRARTGAPPVPAAATEAPAPAAASAPAEAPPAAAPPAEAPPAAAARVVTTRPPRARRTLRARTAPPPPPPPITTAAAPSALASETALLGEALTHLRRGRDGRAALRALDRYEGRHPRGLLAPEAARARVDALFLLGRRGEAGDLLETIPLVARGRDLELLVVRGELRATGDCPAAEADFTRAIAAHPAPALFERALHGRATCRARRGDATGAARDRAEYQRRFPDGRFTPQFVGGS